MEELARAQAAAEGIASRAVAVVEAVRRVAASAPVAEAVAAGKLWREVPVGAEEAGVILEGFIDLLYDTPTGLRVVDYKTDNASPAEIDRRFRHYRLQGGAYALLLQLATGRPVAGVDFVFAANGEIRSIAGAELAALVDEVRARLGQGPAAEDEDERDPAGGEQRQPEAQPVAAAQAGADDPADDDQGQAEDGQLQLSWMAGTEKDQCADPAIRSAAATVEPPTPRRWGRPRMPRRRSASMSGSTWVKCAPPASSAAPAVAQAGGRWAGCWPSVMKAGSMPKAST